MDDGQKKNFAFSERSGWYIVIFTLVILSPIILSLIVDIVHLWTQPLNLADAAMCLDSPEKLEVMIASYHSTIEMYRNSLYAVFGLFALFGISSAVISWSGSNKLSEMQRDLDVARDALKEANELKERYQGYVADIESKLELVGKIEESVSSIDTNIKNELNDAKGIIALARAETERIRNLKFTAERDREEIAGTAKRFKELLGEVQSLPDKADRLREKRIENIELGKPEAAGNEDELDAEIENYIRDLEGLESGGDAEIESALEATQKERSFNQLFFAAISARDKGELDTFTGLVSDIAQLCSKDPENSRWQQHLSILYGFWADMLLREEAVERAHEALLKSQVILERLVESDPHNADWERELGVSHFRLAAVELLRLDYAESEEHAGRAIAILGMLHKRKSTDAFIASRLVQGYNVRAELLLELERYTEAKADLDNALKLIEALTGKDTENTYYMTDFARCCYFLVRYYKESEEDKVDAILYYGKKGYELFEYLQKRNTFFDVENTRMQEYLKGVIMGE